MKCFLLLVITGVSLLAQQTPAQPPSEKPKPIKAALRAKFWRAKSRMSEVKPAYDDAFSQLEAVRVEIVKACGEREPKLDEKGEPACFEKSTPQPQPKSK